MQERTKQRFHQATKLATEMLGEDGVKQNPNIVSALMIGMGVDELADKITEETNKLTDIIVRSADYITK
jgi:hypothetical protein